MSQRPIRKKGILVLALALFTVGLDQVTKQVMMEWLRHKGGMVVVTPFLSFVEVWNRGISFGFLGKEQISPMVFIAFSLIFCLFIFLWACREKELICTIALSLIMGGALGNALDRYLYKAVFDFIDVHGWGYAWPAFNGADSAIVAGVGVLFWKVLSKKKS